MAERKTEADHYELRRGREVICRGTLRNLGYNAERLRVMVRDGYRLYKNGKMVKLCEMD